MSGDSLSQSNLSNAKPKPGYAALHQYRWSAAYRASLLTPSEKWAAYVCSREDHSWFVSLAI